MTDAQVTDFLRRAGAERDLLRAAITGRLTGNAAAGQPASNLMAVSYGMAALLGELSVVATKPGMLNAHLDNLMACVRANAAMKMDASANSVAFGHG